MNLYRQLPKIDRLLASKELRSLHPPFVVSLAREYLDELRGDIAEREEAVPGEEIAQELLARYKEALRPSLRPLVNATGAVLHTNLGRPPWIGSSSRRSGRSPAATATWSTTWTSGDGALLPRGDGADPGDPRSRGDDPRGPYNLYERLDLDCRRGDRALKALTRAKKVVRLAHNLFVTEANLRRALKQMEAIMKEEDFIDIRNFKARSGMSRKYCSPPGVPRPQRGSEAGGGEAAAEVCLKGVGFWWGGSHEGSLRVIWLLAQPAMRRRSPHCPPR